MAETISQGCNGIDKWHWWAIRADLVEQGGLNKDEISIAPMSVTSHSCNGLYQDNHFCLSWVRDAFFLLTMDEYSQPLVDAFAAILEYKPFARYGKAMITVEWDKQATKQRFAALQKMDKLNLERILLELDYECLSCGSDNCNLTHTDIVLGLDLITCSNCDEEFSVEAGTAILF